MSEPPQLVVHDRNPRKEPKFLPECKEANPTRVHLLAAIERLCPVSILADWGKG